MIPPTLFFFFKLIWIFVVFLWFYINFYIDKLNNICFSFVKNTIGILIGIALNVQIALGSLDILLTLILLIHEHSTFFYLFDSFFISFFSILWFSEYRSFKSLVKFIPRYFFLTQLQMRLFPSFPFLIIHYLHIKFCLDFCNNKWLLCGKIKYKIRYLNL